MFDCKLLLYTAPFFEQYLLGCSSRTLIRKLITGCIRHLLQCFPELGVQFKHTVKSASLGFQQHAHYYRFYLVTSHIEENLITEKFPLHLVQAQYDRHSEEPACTFEILLHLIFHNSD